MCKSLPFAVALVTVASAALAGPPAPPVTAAAMPVYAAPLFDAYFNVAAGYNWASNTGLPFSLDNTGAALRGRATFEAALAERFGAQIDGVLGHEWNSFKGFGTSTDDPTTTATLAAHLFWRDPNVGLIGAIGQYTHHDTDLDEGSFKVSITDENTFAGLEGQYFLGNVTLYAQAAYRSGTLTESGAAIDGDGVALAGQARYFIVPNWLVAAKASYDRMTYDLPFSGATDLKIDGWTAGLRSEYRLAAMPVSLFGELTYGEKTYKQFGSEVGEKDTRAMVGIQYNLGTGTLLERDRAGGSLDPFENHFSIPIAGPR